MRAYLTEGDGIDRVAIGSRELRRPGPHDVVVRITHVSLNFRDLLVVEGTAPWKPPGPRIPVSDAAGEVVATGEAVTRFTVGDRVSPIFLPRWLDGELSHDTYTAALGGAALDGVMAESAVFDEQSLVAVAPHLSLAEGATLPVAALTAWHAVRHRSRVQRGDTVLIQGTGGVSLFALQFVHAMGAHAIVLSSRDEKLSRATALGAADTINYSRIPDWEQAVLARTGGRGVDHVMEVVGGAHLNRALAVVRVSGTISFIGLLAGLQAPIATYQFVTRNVRLHGIETGSRTMFEEMNAFMHEHGLRPVIDRTFAFDDFAAALRYLKSGGHVGKIVVTVRA